MGKPPDPIESSRNPRIKGLLRLRKRRFRDREHRFLVEGAREVSRALQAGHDPIEVFFCTEVCSSAAASIAVDLLASNPKTTFRVSKEAFNRLSLRQKPDGIVAVMATWSLNLADLNTVDLSLVLVLHGLEKPGNVGALLRTADSVGADAVLLTGKGTDLFNPNVVRASMGSLFTTQAVHTDATNAQGFLVQKGISLVAATPHADQPHWEPSFLGPTAIVVGSEAAGLDRTWIEAAKTQIRIPMHGAADSLNVATSGAVILYEILRQRTVHGDETSRMG
jgi:TrmH family RNA methyltransferase